MIERSRTVVARGPNLSPYVALASRRQPDEETALSILRYAREHLAPFLRVRRLEFYEPPKTVSGKIRRVDLRTREQQVYDGSTTCTEWRDDQLRG